MANKALFLRPTDEDARVIGALTRRLGLSGQALMRFCLREKAIELGIWSPPTPAATPPEPQAADGPVADG